MKKIYCEKCFCELETKEYDIGIYVIPCECLIGEQERLIGIAIDEAYDNGSADATCELDVIREDEVRDEGYKKGYEHGLHEGKNVIKNIVSNCK